MQLQRTGEVGDLWSEADANLLVDVRAHLALIGALEDCPHTKVVAVAGAKLNSINGRTFGAGTAELVKPSGDRTSEDTRG